MPEAARRWTYVCGHQRWLDKQKDEQITMTQPMTMTMTRQAYDVLNTLL